MDCSAYREAISARIDGEDGGLEVEAIDAHLAACPACRSWAEKATAVTRSSRVGLADPVPDLANQIMAAIMPAPDRPTLNRPAGPGLGLRWRRRPALDGPAAAARARRGSASERPAGAGSGRRSVSPSLEAASPGMVARWGLLMVAAAQVCLAIPALLGNDAGAPVHIAHEQGAWALALAVALLAVAIKPVRAAALLPFVAALAGGLAFTMVIDIAAGRTQAAAEAPHGLAFLGLGMLWLLSRQTRQTPSQDQPGARTRDMARAA